jgi:hypothetical protein
MEELYIVTESERRRRWTDVCVVLAKEEVKIRKEGWRIGNTWAFFSTSHIVVILLRTLGEFCAYL